jgi:hypothetical protein
MAKQKTEVSSGPPDEQVRIVLTDEVRFDEWLRTDLPGQEMTVKRSFLSDPRLVGKFEEL